MWHICVLVYLWTCVVISGLSINAKINNRNDNGGNTGKMAEWHIHVTMHVYSGRQDPTWKIPESHEAYMPIVNNMKTFSNSPLPNKLGYKGFSLVHVPPGGNVVTGGHFNQTLTSYPDWEMFLLQTSQNIGEGLKQYAKQTILSTRQRRRRRRSYNYLDYPESNPLYYTTVDPINYLTDDDMYKLAKLWGLDKLFRNITVTPKPPGPTRFEPEKWDENLVKDHNNCYNYVNDRITDTFAQPGRGGNCEITSYMTHGQDYEKLAKCDGLQVVQAPNENTLPAHNWNLVALVFWPPDATDPTKFDFHWYRLDSNGHWSHKPGKTQATNVDQSDKTILDPRKADRGPYTEFVTFMQTRQDKVLVI